MQTAATNEKKISELDRLNNNFVEKNDEFYQLLDRLIMAGHRLNDTNTPTESVDKQSTQQFSPGALLCYDNNLKRMGESLYRLRDVVEKIEGII